MRDRSGSASDVSTLELLERAKGGDAGARDAVFDRYLPRALHFAHGRLPIYARDALETADIVQDVLLKTIQRVNDLEFENEGDLLAYLRAAIVNRVRNELRAFHDGPRRTTLGADVEDPADAHDALARREDREAYERAVRRLPRPDATAIIARVEFGMSYREIGAILGTSEDGARMRVHRALPRLRRLVREPRRSPP